LGWRSAHRHAVRRQRHHPSPRAARAQAAARKGTAGANSTTGFYSSTTTRVCSLALQQGRGHQAPRPQQNNRAQHLHSTAGHHNTRTSTKLLSHRYSSHARTHGHATSSDTLLSHPWVLGEHGGAPVHMGCLGHVRWGVALGCCSAGGPSPPPHRCSAYDWNGPCRCTALRCQAEGIARACRGAACRAGWGRGWRSTSPSVRRLRRVCLVPAPPLPAVSACQAIPAALQAGRLPASPSCPGLCSAGSWEQLRTEGHLPSGALGLALPPRRPT